MPDSPAPYTPTPATTRIDPAAQPFSVKRAQVEFHNFASLGEPERNLRIYSEENTRRRTVLLQHLDFIGDPPHAAMTPFLEIGANAGHTSYMLCNEFGAEGFALDISADSLRHGRALMDAWNLQRAPVRMGGDALNLPFADNSLRMVCTFQTLSQFMDIESVFREVHRVLQPGGVFFFAEEPLLRKWSLRLYRCPYYETMKPWERRLYDWGLLGYIVQDVIGADQEESFGIRQNHTMGLTEWAALIRKYFPEQRYELFVPERGWGESIVKRFAFSGQHAARWLGGTLAAFGKKAGELPAAASTMTSFETLLRCPDCHSTLARDAAQTLICTGCGYQAPFREEVYNLLNSADREELYPGERDDIIDFSLPGHERQLVGDWYELEGVHGNLYRWIGARADAHLKRVKPGPQRLRIRGHASEQGVPGKIRVVVNGALLKTWDLERTGLFVLEADLPDATDYIVEIHGSPTWSVPTDDRVFSVTLSMIRLTQSDPGN